MEKWTVTAVNGNLKAKSGNNHPLFIIVSIEDTNGAPVQSLTVDNFLLAAEVAGGLAFSETSRSTRRPPEDRRSVAAC